MKGWSFAPRRIFAAGLLVTLPGVVAGYVLWAAFSYLDGILEPLVLRAAGRRIPGLSFLALVTIVFLVGLLASNILGARIVAAVSAWLEKIPIFRSLYRAFRDVGQVFLGDRASAFRRVAMMEWPRPGIHTLVFVMAESSGAAEKAVGQGLVPVFLPTSPNPATGFVMLVPPAELRAVDLNVEQALKLVISAGAAFGVGAPRGPAPAAGEAAVPGGP